MADKATGTALAETGQAQLDVIANAILGKGELPPAADPEAMSRAIMERILNAQSFEDAFTQQNLTPWRSMLGREVKVTDVHFNRSTVEGDGPPVYAVCDLVDTDTGETISVSCGGANVLMQLVVGVRNGWFADNAVRLIENKTANGYGALWLEAV